MCLMVSSPQSPPGAATPMSGKNDMAESGVTEPFSSPKDSACRRSAQPKTAARETATKVAEGIGEALARMVNRFESLDTDRERAYKQILGLQKRFNDQVARLGRAIERTVTTSQAGASPSDRLGKQTRGAAREEPSENISKATDDARWEEESDLVRHLRDTWPQRTRTCEVGGVAVQVTTGSETNSSLDAERQTHVRRGATQGRRATGPWSPPTTTRRLSSAMFLAVWSGPSGVCVVVTVSTFQSVEYGKRATSTQCRHCGRGLAILLPQEDVGLAGHVRRGNSDQESGSLPGSHLRCNVETTSN